MPYVIVEWDEETDPSFFTGTSDQSIVAQDAMRFETAEAALAFGSKLGDVLSPLSHVVELTEECLFSDLNDQEQYKKFSKAFFGGSPICFD